MELFQQQGERRRPRHSAVSRRLGFFRLFGHKVAVVCVQVQVRYLERMKLRTQNNIDAVIARVAVHGYVMWRLRVQLMNRFGLRRLRFYTADTKTHRHTDDREQCACVSSAETAEQRSETGWN